MVFGNKFLHTLNSTAKVIKASAEDVKKEIEASDLKMPDIKLPDVSDIKLPDVSEISNIKLPDVSDIRKDLSDLKVPDIKVPDLKDIKSVDDLKDRLFSDRKQEEEVNETEITAIATGSALKIIYYLISIDGLMSDSEEKQFDIILRELDPEKLIDKEVLLADCMAQLSKAFSGGDYYAIVQDGVERELHHRRKSGETYITPKALLWDLLMAAYSDDEYGDQEIKLIRYIALRLNIDSSVLLEMESSIKTLQSLEQELVWIKKTNRPYLEIEAMVNEITDRKNTVFESIKDLAAL